PNAQFTQDTQNTSSSRRRWTKVRMFQSFFLKGRTKIIIGGNTETHFGAESEGMAIQSLPHLGFQPIYIQLPNLDNIADAKKCKKFP
ncbi:hypothetical protein P7M14_23590, partial [Vibrio parahaemolyticus]|nr:hypothetical protein [Vibrio parahaemolyticus]